MDIFPFLMLDMFTVQRSFVDIQITNSQNADFQIVETKMLLLLTY
jgi:hypothetical protein